MGILDYSYKELKTIYDYWGSTIFTIDEHVIQWFSPLQLWVAIYFFATTFTLSRYKPQHVHSFDNNDCKSASAQIVFSKEITK